MATDAHNRPIREIPNDTTAEELQAGHIIPGAHPPKNEDARGGYGNRDGKEGFGTDSGSGSTAVSVNENADKVEHPHDNMRTSDEGRPDRANQDLPSPDSEVISPAGPVDELDADDARATDEMSDPDSRVGMGQMEPAQPDATITNTQANAELTDPGATDTAIAQ